MKQIKMCFSAALSAGLLCVGLILGTNAYAVEVDPCVEDISKFCQNINPGVATIQCLESHESELTDACRAYEEKAHGRRGEIKERVQEQNMFRQACGTDMAQFCKYSDPASGGIMGCLKKHDKELSLPCVERLKAMESGKE